MNKVTPSKVTSLKDNEVFVFGSNEAGIHGKGAAKLATKWGAIYGIPEGFMTQVYAIPTKDKTIKYTLPIETIEKYVETFINFAKENDDKVFLVTEIGCGLAGLTPSDVAPLFEKAKELNNVWLPISFWRELNGLILF